MTIGNRNHIVAYIFLPHTLKRELFKEFNNCFPKIGKTKFTALANGRQPFPLEEWKSYIELLKKYDAVWDEQRLEEMVVNNKNHYQLS